MTYFCEYWVKSVVNDYDCLIIKDKQESDEHVYNSIWQVLNEELNLFSNGNTDSEKITKILYSELKSLRDNAQLVPGQQYRITDYECTTAQDYTQSAMHEFDIIVTAIDESHLSEDAKAAHHWINCIVLSDTEGDLLMLRRKDLDDENGYAWGFAGIYTSVFNPNNLMENLQTFAGTVETHYTKDNLVAFTQSDTPNVGDIANLGNDLEVVYVGQIQETYFENCNLDAWKLRYCLDNDDNKFVWADTTNGKGVIHLMIDEFNNECPYDFKNILMQDLFNPNSNDPYYDKYCYTMRKISNTGNIVDFVVDFCNNFSEPSHPTVNTPCNIKTYALRANQNKTKFVPMIAHIAADCYAFGSLDVFLDNTNPEKEIIPFNFITDYSGGVEYPCNIYIGDGYDSNNAAIFIGTPNSFINSNIHISSGIVCSKFSGSNIKIKTTIPPVGLWDIAIIESKNIDVETPVTSGCYIGNCENVLVRHGRPLFMNVRNIELYNASADVGYSNSYSGYYENIKIFGDDYDCIDSYDNSNRHIIVKAVSTTSSNMGKNVVCHGRVGSVLIPTNNASYETHFGVNSNGDVVRWVPTDNIS